MRVDLPQGTLETMVLKPLSGGPMRGYGIGKWIERTSNALTVEGGSLYPALHRLEEEGWIEAEWGASEANRQAKFYELTRAGRKQPTAEEENWQRIAEGGARVLTQA